VSHDLLFVEYGQIAIDIVPDKHDVSPIVIADCPLWIIEQVTHQSGRLASRPFMHGIQDCADLVFAEYPGIFASPDF
jgi:hypothetical protein